MALLSAAPLHASEAGRQGEGAGVVAAGGRRSEVSVEASTGTRLRTTALEEVTVLTGSGTIGGPSPMFRHSFA